MLTARGWWFLLFVLTLLAMGGIVALPNQRGTAGPATLLLLGLALFLWFAWEWLAFAVRLHFLLPKLYLERTLHDDRGPVKTLWAGRVFHVRTRLRLPAPLRLPFLVCAEGPPCTLTMAGWLPSRSRLWGT